MLDPRVPVHATAKVILAEDPTWSRHASVRLEAVEVLDHILFALAYNQVCGSSRNSHFQNRYAP